MTCSETEVGSETGVCAASMARRAVWRVGRRCQSSINKIVDDDSAKRRSRRRSLSFPLDENASRRRRVFVRHPRSIDRSIEVTVAFEFTVDPTRSPFERVDFAIDFQFHPRFHGLVFQNQTSMAVLTRTVCRWAGWVPSRFVGHEESMEGYCSASHPSLARSPGAYSPRVAVAPRPARDRFGESLGSRLVRLEDRPRGKLASFRQTRSGLCVTPKKGLSTSDIAPCFRPWCGGTPPRVGNRPARRGSRRGKRAPVAFRIPRATPTPKRDSEPRRSPRAPRRIGSARIGNNARASRSTRFANAGI